MAESKKFYWLRLKENFFNTKEVKKLRRIAGGDTYTIIYLKLQLLSIKNGGLIKFDNTEESLEEQLSLEIDESLDNVTITLSFMKANNLIESIGGDEFLLPSVPPLVGSETDAAERMRKMRERNNVTPMLQSVTQRKELENKEDKREEIKDKQEAFTNFWKSYPKKKSKGTAEKAWAKINPSLHDTIIASLEKHKQSADWLKEGGQFIPYPATWLNAKGWEDEIEEKPVETSDSKLDDMFAEWQKEITK